MKEAIIDAVLGLAGAGVQQAFGAANMKRQHNYSKQLLQFQWDNQVPSVVNSLKRAGLNPGLMYSNGGPSVGGSTGQTTAPQVGNPLLGVGDVLNQSKLVDAEADIKRITAQNLQREFDDKHWMSVADIDLIRDTISDRAKQREIATSQLVLEREKFEFDKLMRGDENQREWLEAYRREAEFMLDSYKKAFENAHLQERYDAEMRNMNAYTTQMLATAKSLLGNLELREKELNLQERKMVADFRFKYKELEDLNTRVGNQLEFDKSRWSDKKEQFDQTLEYNYAKLAMEFSSGLIGKAMETFEKFYPKSTVVTKKGGKTITTTSRE